ncbi:MAG: DNA repair protein RadC [Bacteroidetes bacterium]|nr:DNA repair protein RadC [Bacteroidota bacterium]
MNQKHISIKSLAEEDRPREKFLKFGRSALSDAELLAIVLSSGNKNETAIQLAQRILNSYQNNLANIAKLTISDFKKFKGIGTVKAINILASLELGRRRNLSDTPQRVKILISKNAYDIFMIRLSDLNYEEFWILLLNRASEVIAEFQISKGGVSATIVDVRAIAKKAIECSASSIVLGHNHPSGNIIPSESDIKLTSQIKDALKLFDVSLLDHIIVGEQKYYSFADEGKL